MASYRFDRHELFTGIDLAEVMSILRELDNIALENDTYMEGKHSELSNMIYGLMDGYLYDNLLTTATGWTKVPMGLLKRLESIVDKVVESILDNGQAVTTV